MLLTVLRRVHRAATARHLCLHKTLVSCSNTLAADSMATQPMGKCLVWVDCEMTGLDVATERILEVAVIITDTQLKELQEVGPLVVGTPKPVLDSMNDWCKKHHGDSGLVAACLESKLTIEQVDQQLFDVCQRFNINNGLLAGNSVNFDRTFLNKYCPKFASCLHYRTVDVSTVKELVRLWYKKDESFKKQLTHRAIDDIRESIAELKYYRQNYFITK